MKAATYSKKNQREIQRKTDSALFDHIISDKKNSIGQPIVSGESKSKKTRPTRKCRSKTNARIKSSILSSEGRNEENKDDQVPNRFTLFHDSEEKKSNPRKRAARKKAEMKILSRLVPDETETGSDHVDNGQSSGELFIEKKLKNTITPFVRKTRASSKSKPKRAPIVLKRARIKTMKENTLDSSIEVARDSSPHMISLKRNSSECLIKKPAHQSSSVDSVFSSEESMDFSSDIAECVEEPVESSRFTYTYTYTYGSSKTSQSSQKSEASSPNVTMKKYSKWNSTTMFKKNDVHEVAMPVVVSPIYGSSETTPEKLPSGSKVSQPRKLKGKRKSVHHPLKCSTMLFDQETTDFTFGPTLTLTPIENKSLREITCPVKHQLHEMTSSDSFLASFSDYDQVNLVEKKKCLQKDKVPNLKKNFVSRIVEATAETNTDCCDKKGSVHFMLPKDGPAKNALKENDNDVFISPEDFSIVNGLKEKDNGDLIVPEDCPKVIGLKEKDNGDLIVPEDCPLVNGLKEKDNGDLIVPEDCPIVNGLKEKDNGDLIVPEDCPVVSDLKGNDNGDGFSSDNGPEGNALNESHNGEDFILPKDVPAVKAFNGFDKHDGLTVNALNIGDKGDDILQEDDLVSNALDVVNTGDDFIVPEHGSALIENDNNGKCSCDSNVLVEPYELFVNKHVEYEICCVNRFVMSMSKYYLSGSERSLTFLNKSGQ